MVENWPDWRISSGNAGELARYVDTSHTRNWVPADVRGPWPGPGEGRSRAERLYEELRAHKIGYAHEPWNPRRHREGEEFVYQRIRGPEETMQGPATCLDLALVYAGMALCAGLRPFIGLRTGQDPHALVLLDVRSAVSDMAVADGLNAPPLTTARSNDPGVWNVRDPAALLRWDGAEGWLLVDVARAARRGDAGSARFSEASGWGLAEHLAGTRGDYQWTVVDVDMVVARSDHASYTPPTGLAVPPIHGYLPAVPTFYEYGTRQKVLARLLDLVDATEPGEPSVLVLQAPQGFGKSMLAHRLAVAADHGCGWFLTAPDVKSLTASLAMAERQEKELRGGPAATGATGEKPDPGEDRALASGALDRLRNAERPWVVVLDNCDVDPTRTPGLQELVPVPHSLGQTVIITTIDEHWEDYARSRGWIFERLRPLDPDDLGDLGLPPGLSGLIHGRPLIAQALAALQEAGADLPDQADTGGPELVWDLVRKLPGAGPEVTTIARVLAWCPPEPADTARLLTAAGYLAGAQAPPALAACHTLDQMRFVTLSFPDSGMAVQMHRLFAAAVRSQTWRDDPGLAADIMGRLLTGEAGQELFIGAAEESALSRLERGPGRDDPGEVARAAGYLANPARRGLLWHGLGRVRERRGPVSQSAPHFRTAAELLERGSYPAEVAESLIGPARVVYQNGASSPGELIEARDVAADARRLAGSLTDQVAMQLSEQANALVWLITQKLAQRETDLTARAAALAEVRDNLWQSYERRRRILRPEPRPEPGSNPALEDGLGSERAFFNLAGVNIQLAKIHHKMANVTGAQRDAALAEVAEDLDQAARVYEVVRELREQRYAGRAHPHLASCVHGQALVAYFRATLLGDVGQYPAAFGFAGTALEQRRKVAGGLAGPEAAGVLQDNDMNKSVEFMFKLSYTAMAARANDPGDCAAAVGRLLAEVPDEFDGSLPTVAIGSGD
jgi:hypothetical protein